MVGLLRLTVLWLGVAAALWGCAAPTAAARPLALRTTHPEVQLVSVVHRVERGQTLYRIARAYGLTADELMAANGLSDPRALEVGRALVIPGAARVLEVEPAPGLLAESSKAEGPPSRPALVSKLAASAPPPPRPSSRTPRAAVRPQLPVGKGSGRLSWPLRGVLYGRFGKKGREVHDGIDLAAPKGSAVRTAAAGKVVFAGEQRGYGQLVIIDHGEEWVTLYAHNHDLRVQAGQQVREGQVIATVGESGRTSGPHLHFEVRHHGLPVDPLGQLGPVPAS